MEGSLLGTLVSLWAPSLRGDQTELPLHSPEVGSQCHWEACV